MIFHLSSGSDGQWPVEWTGLVGETSRSQRDSAVGVSLTGSSVKPQQRLLAEAPCFLNTLLNSAFPHLPTSAQEPLLSRGQPALRHQREFSYTCANRRLLRHVFALASKALLAGYFLVILLAQSDFTFLPHLPCVWASLFPFKCSSYSEKFSLWLWARSYKFCQWVMEVFIPAPALSQWKVRIWT